MVVVVVDVLTVVLPGFLLGDWVVIGVFGNGGRRNFNNGLLPLLDDSVVVVDGAVIPSSSSSPFEANRASSVIIVVLTSLLSGISSVLVVTVLEKRLKLEDTVGRILNLDGVELFGVMSGSFELAGL